MSTYQKMLKVVAFGRNSKLGEGVHCTYRPVGDTCPADCALLGNGCYAERGRTRIHANHSRDDAHEFTDKIDDDYGLMRHAVTGDAYQDDKLDTEYVEGVIAFHESRPGMMGWTYTHRIQDWDVAGYHADAMPSNLHVIASVDTEKDRLYAVENGWRYARVVEHDDVQLLENEAWCPVDKQKRAGEAVTTCKRCKICFQTSKNIVFLLQKPKAPPKRKPKSQTEQKTKDGKVIKVSA